LTQRLVAQPRFETNVAARDVEKFGVAAPHVPCKEYSTFPLRIFVSVVKASRPSNLQAVDKVGILFAFTNGTTYAFINLQLDGNRRKTDEKKGRLSI
jgi:hypothetical protein